MGTESLWTSLVAQTVQRLSTMRETRVQSLGWEDPLEKEMAIHSSTIAWKIPWTEEPGRLQSMGLQSQMRLSDFMFMNHFEFFATPKFQIPILLCVLTHISCFSHWLEKSQK